MYSQYLMIIVIISFLYNSEQISGYNVIEKILDQCASRDQMIKCLKIQALKITNRALQAKSLNIIDGVSLTRNNRMAKYIYLGLNDTELEKFEPDQLDKLLKDTSFRFLETHKLDVNIPRLLEEGRKKGKGENNGALYWALAIKGSFLAMAYKGIAIMAGLALIMGKMALLLSAILGLKKLVSSGHETTTFEIIKQPKYTEQHTHSTSYEDDHHRSYDYADMYPYQSQRIYKNYI